MPLYDYDCAACGRRLEVVHGVQAPGPTHCPNCGGGPLKKAITAPAVHFKGTGWAKRDRRATVTPAASKTSGDAATTADGGVKDGGQAARGSRSESRTEGGAGGADDGGERAAASARTTGADAATKTD